MRKVCPDVYVSPGQALATNGAIPELLPPQAVQDLLGAARQSLYHKEMCLEPGIDIDSDSDDHAVNDDDDDKQPLQ